MPIYEYFRKSLSQVYGCTRYMIHHEFVGRILWFVYNTICSVRKMCTAPPPLSHPDQRVPVCDTVMDIYGGDVSGSKMYIGWLNNALRPIYSYSNGNTDLVNYNGKCYFLFMAQKRPYLVVWWYKSHRGHPSPSNAAAAGICCRLASASVGIIPWHWGVKRRTVAISVTPQHLPAPDKDHGSPSPSRDSPSVFKATFLHFTILPFVTKFSMKTNIIHLE